MLGLIASLVRPGRDLRVDFVRGIALWFIFIDHTPGNLLGQMTLRNVAFMDATEAFVLLAGYASGIAYGRLLEREGWASAAAKVAGRVFTLYVAHIFLFVIFTAQVGFSAEALDQAAYLDELQLDPFREDPYRALLEALLLRYQPHFLDILPLYIAVLAMFALTLPLARRPMVLLALAFALYVATRWFGIALPAWNRPAWFFNPFAWQLLFAIGVVLARADRRWLASTFRWNRWLAALACAVLLAAAVALNLVWNGPSVGLEPPDWLASWMATVDKTGLHPARLGSVLIATWLIAHWLPAGAGFLTGRWAAPFVLMGQQSLPVFCAGIAFSFLGRVALEISEGAAMLAAVNLVGLAALVAVGAIAAWYSGEGKRQQGGHKPPQAGHSPAHHVLPVQTGTATP